MSKVKKISEVMTQTSVLKRLKETKSMSNNFQKKQDISSRGDNFEKPPAVVVGLTKSYKQSRDNNKIESRKVVEELKNILKIGDKNFQEIIYIFGNRGNGKTFSVQYFLENICKKFGWVGRYITLIKLVNELYAMDFKERKQYLDNLIERYDVLIIDEIDKCNLTSWQESNIFFLLDERNSSLKKTIYISNKKIGDLKNNLKENIISRIVDEALIIHWKGQNLR